ncbi:hypothetical protein DOTSEDRAFT_48870 [Dothistroma septosporum NZE10]|uniref:AB hydrolase-1 domain-containing protein n=1 Tax=Dothistroma septosporum (strain NZE10 / CBS 128990) TaxID=675120 RepID=N1Q152_DOTSN|nr:hypothetical protein DOTSEDRAFT_48870 [Dothistroma septosporum NZE10]
MPPTSPLLSRIAYGLAGAVGVYAVLLGVLLTPPMQRFALYANSFNTLFLGDDLHNGERFGFAKNQVTPFNITTSDGEDLFAWHILPLDVYAQNEKVLRKEKRPHGQCVQDITASLSFKLLASDKNARVVISFHGNAGHIAQNQRPLTNRYMTTQPNTHVLSIDYRGFGLSTGSPTEAGLVADGVALIDWILHVAKVPSERIVIIGQSLGTAVSSAVALRYADPDNMSGLTPIDAPEMKAIKKRETKPIIFAGVVLAAPFNSVPTLLSTYRIGGLLPILLPLRPFPWLLNMLTSQMVDKWLTAERLTAYYDALKDNTALAGNNGALGSLQVLHALNDADIPYHQTEMICRRMLGQRSADAAMDPDELDADHCIDGTKGTGVLDVKMAGRPRLRFELVGYGGHNRIITHTPVSLAVLRAFDGLFD